MQRLGMEEGVPIEHGMVTRAIERAQKQVEAQNFSVRKHLLEYDDVMNKQRENIYALRRADSRGPDPAQDEDDEEDVVGTREYLMTLAEDILDALVDDLRAARGRLRAVGSRRAQARGRRASSRSTPATLDFSDQHVRRDPRRCCGSGSATSYEEKEKLVGREVLQRVERDIMLQIVDAQWKDHLYSLDHLKEGIGLRGYGQRDPLVEYKKESFAAVPGDEGARRRGDRPLPVVAAAGAQRGGGGPVAGAARPRAGAPPLILNDPGATSPRRSGASRAQAPQPSPFAGSAAPQQQQPARVGGDDAAVKTVRRDEPKVGRNDPCPCGSGKKYKKCHGAAA